MNDIVENNVKPSGAIVTPSPETLPEPTTQPRIFTYRLRGGGYLTLPCPAWCTSSHESDLDGTLHPADLRHQGDEISLGFTTSNGEETNILAARISQFPFSTDDDGSEYPHMALMANAGSGDTQGYLSTSEMYAEIRRVREYLLKLEQLNGQLVAAERAAWMSLSEDDIRNMAITDLLAAFEAVVVEVDEVERGGLAILQEVDEQLQVHVLRTLTQQQREAAVRNSFLTFTGQNR